MPTVTPRRAETLEESSERRELFCLIQGLVKGTDICREVSWGALAEIGVGLLFSFVGVGHGGGFGRLGNLKDRLRL